MSEKEAGTAVQERPVHKALAGIDEETLARMTQHAGQGLDKVKIGDVALPFLQIMQPLSPQVMEGNKKLIEGVRPGMIINTLTKEVWSGKDGVIVCPIDFETKYNLWKKRTAGGGFNGTYDSTEDAKRAAAEKKLNPDQIDIVDTSGHYLLARNNDKSWGPVLFPLKSTARKVSREWVSDMQSVVINTPKGQVTPPSFAFLYSVTTVVQTKDDYTWYTPVIERVGVTPREVFEAAFKFFNDLRGGKITVTYNEDGSGTEAAEESKEKGRPPF